MFNNVFSLTKITTVSICRCYLHLIYNSTSVTIQEHMSRISCKIIFQSQSWYLVPHWAGATTSKDIKKISHLCFLRDDYKYVITTILHSTELISNWFTVIMIQTLSWRKHTVPFSPAGPSSASYNGFLCTALQLQPSVWSHLKELLHLLGVLTPVLQCL